MVVAFLMRSSVPSIRNTMFTKAPKPMLVKAINVINTTKHPFQVECAFDSVTGTMQVKISAPREGQGVVIEPERKIFLPDWSGNGN